MASKRYKKLPKKTNELAPDLIEKLIPEIKKNCTTKFDESIDVNFKLNLKQKKSEINIRTVLILPVGKNKKINIIQFLFLFLTLHSSVFPHWTFSQARAWFCDTLRFVAYIA